MTNLSSELIGGLFETNAIRVCPENKPFFYTSGKIGPYYINTHFLYGSQKKAESLLKAIDEEKADKLDCSAVFHRMTLENYRQDPIYRKTIDTLVETIRGIPGAEEAEYISGGERRDWFFSFLVADFLGKPHITLFKDMDAVVYKEGASQKIEVLKGASVLHIADLITTASSYERAWVPAIKSLGGNMIHSLVVVDRLQGGEEVLKKLDVKSHALVAISAETFEKAFKEGFVTKPQLDMVLNYMNEPEASMKSFLEGHPEFLEETLKGGGKDADRARLLLDSHFYGL